jgi:hypothetical protein
MSKFACVMGVAFLVALSSGARANVTEENFRLDTTRDLVALCGVDAGDPNAVAAIHMCHGYVTGLVHFHIVMGRALEVEWSKAHPENDSSEAVDGVLLWAADTYPCSE